MDSPNKSYLELGRDGNSAWWAYLLGFVLIVISYAIGNVALLIAVVVCALIGSGKMPTVNDNGDFVGVEPVMVFLSIGLMFVCMLVGVVLVVHLLHRRPILSLITAYGAVNPGKIAFGFVVWFCLCMLDVLGNYLLFPQTFSLTLNWSKFLPFIPAVLLVIPVQTLAEELVCRGYFLQGLSSLVRNPWLLAAVNGTLFMLPHLPTPGLENLFIMGLTYFSMGFILAIVSIRTNGLEVAYGAHMANNMVPALLFNYVNSPLPTSSVFVCTDMNEPYELVASVIAAVVFYFLTMKYMVRSD